MKRPLNKGLMLYLDDYRVMAKIDFVPLSNGHHRRKLYRVFNIPDADCCVRAKPILGCAREPISSDT